MSDSNPAVAGRRLDRRTPGACNSQDELFREATKRGSNLNVVLITHTFGFPEGYAASLRARLVSRALVREGASVRVFCTRYSEIPPDVLNTQARGIYEGVEFRYTNGSVSRSPSFARRRIADSRGLVSALLDVARLRKAGELDLVYLWSSQMRWHPLSEAYVAFLNALRVPIVLEVNERSWSEAPKRSFMERALSPLHGISGVIAISKYLEEWAKDEAARLGRVIPVFRLPIVVDTDEVTAAGASGFQFDRPFVLFACPPGRSALFEIAAAAMQQVWIQGITCDLVIVGPSAYDERNRWLGDIQTDSVYGSIKWLGRVPRPSLLGLYREARALLLPLEVELNSQARFPTKLGEYLASGTPVVATRLGELSRFLADGKQAYLAEPGNAAVFGRRLAQLLTDDSRAAEVGQRGRELAVREFDYRCHGAALRDWLDTIYPRGRRG